MAANEEDYLDGLLKSLSDKENAESELKDEEEEEIKEQVREAVEKSNETNSQYENIYVDDQAENDEKQAKEEKVEEVLKDVMTVPREMAAPVLMKHLLWTSLNRKNLSQRNNRLHRKRWLSLPRRKKMQRL